MTYLEIVQRALSAINSFSVNSIGETRESEQVALIVKTIMEELWAMYPWAHKTSRGTLEVTATANIMKIPDNKDEVKWIRYNSDDNGRYEVHFMPPKDFREMLDSRLDGGLANIDSIGAFNDQDPTYWTTDDDTNIEFDGYDGSLAANKTDVMFVESLSIPSTADWGSESPDLPTKFHTVLLQGVLGTAFADLKGDDTAANRYEGRYIKGRTRMKAYLSRTGLKPTTRKVDYGRKTLPNRFRNIDSRRVNG